MKRISPPIETETTPSQPVRSTPVSGHCLLGLVKAMRLHHWVKNGVIFAAPIFGEQLSPDVFIRVLFAFMVFSLTASGVYLLNDVMDRHADRAHPKKCKRPIASGVVPVPVAAATGFVLILGSLLASYALSPLLLLCMLAYLVIQIGYNLGLKRRAIMDIFCISGGFVLRAMAGSAAVGIMPSDWFILCVGFLSLYLAIEKRKAELNALGGSGQTRQVLQVYSLPWLNKMEGIITAAILMTYTLWTIEGAQTSWMMLTIPFVLYGLFKYQYLVETGEGEAPEATLLKTPLLFINIILWATTVILVLLFT